MGGPLPFDRVSGDGTASLVLSAVKRELPGTSSPLVTNDVRPPLPLLAFFLCGLHNLEASNLDAGAAFGLTTT